MSFALVALLAAVPLTAQVKPEAAANQAMLQKYCSGCHNKKLRTAGVSVEGLDLSSVAGKAEISRRSCER